MPDDLRERIAELRVMRRNSYGRPGDVVAAANLAPALADEVERLRAALLALANWQVERRPGGSGEMCDFADAALKGSTRDG